MVIVPDYVINELALFVLNGDIRGLGVHDGTDFGWEVTIFEGEAVGKILTFPPGTVYVLRPPRLHIFGMMISADMKI